MSTGKRLAKRSILGTRVVAPGDDGRLYPGIIADMKTPEGGSSSTSDTSTNHIRYTVRFDENRKTKEFFEGEIIGPGFSSVTSSKLRPKQKVWVTNANREMEGYVLHHRPNIDQVIVQLNGGPEVKKKLEEVRLMESRKSARLIGQGNTDFSKLADFNIVHERKRLNSETSDISSGTTCGRKRRGSETLSDSSGDEYYGMNGIISTSTHQLSSYWNQSPSSRQQLNSTPILDPASLTNDQSNNGIIGDGCRSGPVMSECTAALVLMNLSHSPANNMHLSNNLSDVAYAIKKGGPGLENSSVSATILPASTQLYLANLESGHMECSQSKHTIQNQKRGHVGHVRCLPGGACLVGSDFSSSLSSRLPQEQVQEPTDLSQTSVSTHISSNLNLSCTITTSADTRNAQRSVETATINSSPPILGLSESSSSSSESSFPPASSLCASTVYTVKSAASPTSSTMSASSASIVSNSSIGSTIILPQFGISSMSTTNLERSVSPSSTSGVSSLGNSWASTPTMVTVVPPSGAANIGSISYNNTSSHSISHSSAAPSPASSLLTTSSVHLTEAEALLQLSNQESDEGIVSDQSSSADPDDASKRVKIEHVRIIYQCTWPGCRVKADVCVDIERHVRSKHLGRREPVTEDDIDHEEEFYYTEVEVPLSASLSDLATPPSPSSPIATIPSTASNGLQNMNCQFISNSVQISPLIYNGTNGSNSTVTLPSSFTKTNPIVNGLPVLLDHMDMARPPHENPEIVHRAQIINRPISQTQQQLIHQQPRRLIASTSAVNAGPGTIIIPQSHLQQQQQQLQQPQSIFQTVRQPIAAAPANALPIAIPVTSFAFTATNATNQPMSAMSTNAHHAKYIRLSPKPYNAATPTGSLGRNNPSSPINNSQNIKSPIRRPRGDAKKCRKVYGMDHRDLWCTQCKWKKACTRFGESN